MFTFAHPGLLFLLLVVPGLFCLYLLSRFLRKRRLRKFGRLSSIGQLMPQVSKYKSQVKVIILLIVVSALVFALARPWGGIKNQDSTRQGIEVVIAVDASNSMLASSTGSESDVDRMRSAKLQLEKLINRLGNDRVGLIAYAGDAYTLIPVTNDYVSAKTFLNSINPAEIPHQGTNITAAIASATRSFSPTNDIGKAIILITDAEELENKEEVIESVKRAAKQGIQVDVLGVGSNEPVPIPEGTGLMMDPETGEPVKTKLDENLAIEIAKAGKGIYVNASNNDAIDELEKQLSKQKKMALESSFSAVHDELYLIFAWIAFAFLLVFLFIADSKNNWLDKFNFFKKETASSLLMRKSGKKTTVVLLAISASMGLSSCHKKIELPEQDSQTDKVENVSKYEGSSPRERDLILEGIDRFHAGDFQGADSCFVAALNYNPKSLVALLNGGLANIGKARMIQEKVDSLITPEDSVAFEGFMRNATDSFQKAAEPKVRKGNVSSLAFYNAGNIFFNMEQYDNSIELYKESLRLNPDDDHARRNLRIAQLKKKENQENQDKKNNQDQEQEQNQQQDQEQQQEQQPQQPDQINEQTSQQILDAAERKENQKRLQMKINEQRSSENSGSSNKGW